VTLPECTQQFNLPAGLCQGEYLVAADPVRRNIVVLFWTSTRAKRSSTGTVVGLAARMRCTALPRTIYKQVAAACVQRCTLPDPVMVIPSVAAVWARSSIVCGDILIRQRAEDQHLCQCRAVTNRCSLYNATRMACSSRCFGEHLLYSLGNLIDDGHRNPRAISAGVWLHDARKRISRSLHRLASHVWVAIQAILLLFK